MSSRFYALPQPTRMRIRSKIEHGQSENGTSRSCRLSVDEQESGSRSGRFVREPVGVWRESDASAALAPSAARQTASMFDSEPSDFSDAMGGITTLLIGTTPPHQNLGTSTGGCKAISPGDEFRLTL